VARPGPGFWCDIIGGSGPSGVRLVLFLRLLAFMRFNKTIFAFLLAVSLTPSAFPQPTPASNPAAVGSVKQVTNHAEEGRNEGRKLSMSVPGLGTAHITVTPAANGPLFPAAQSLQPGRRLVLGKPSADKSAAKKDISFVANGGNITVRVPDSVDAAIEDLQTVSRQVGKIASKGMYGAGHFVDMIVQYVKQWTGNSTITPGGYPYVEKASAFPAPAPGTFGGPHRLYYTGEGRLKSVVTR